MSTISKANRPRKQPGFTRNGRMKLTGKTALQLQIMLKKATTAKQKGKILQQLAIKEAKSRH